MIKELSIKYAFLSWDYKSSPNWNTLSEYAQDGLIFFNEIETNSDYYSIIVSNVKLTNQQIQFLIKEDDHD